MLLIITGAGVYKDGPEGWTVHFRGKLDGTEIFEYDSRISRITTVVLRLAIFLVFLGRPTIFDQNLGLKNGLLTKFSQNWSVQSGRASNFPQKRPEILFFRTGHVIPGPSLYG